MPKIVLLWSDVVVLATVLVIVLYAWRVHGNVNLRANWMKVLRDRAAVCASVVLVLFFSVAVVDSLHFRRALSSTAGGQAAYGTRTESLLDLLLTRQLKGRETSYSAPFAKSLCLNTVARMEILVPRAGSSNCT